MRDIYGVERDKTDSLIDGRWTRIFNRRYERAGYVILGQGRDEWEVAYAPGEETPRHIGFGITLGHAKVLAEKDRLKQLSAQAAASRPLAELSRGELRAFEWIASLDASVSDDNDVPAHLLAHVLALKARGLVERDTTVGWVLTPEGLRYERQLEESA